MRRGNQDRSPGTTCAGDRAPAPGPVDAVARLSDEEATLQARRRVLKLVAYAGPLVVGTFLARDAEAGSCFPPTPCYPIPCAPKGCDPMQ